jgi:hypothetical protein
MVWLILGIKRCARTDRIDVTVDVYVEMSQRGSAKNHVKCSDTTKNDHI